MSKAPEKIEKWINEHDYNGITNLWISNLADSSKSYKVISADWVDWKIAEMQKEIDELRVALQDQVKIKFVKKDQNENT